MSEMNINNPNTQVSDPQYEEKKRWTEIRERVFEGLVTQHLVSLYEENMADLDFSEEEIASFKRKMSTLSSKDVLSFLSLPHELRKRSLNQMKSHLISGKQTIEGWVDSVIQMSQKYGFTVGYHLSQSDILPKRLPGGEERWEIDGRELDDRDDMQMAYYSLDYANMFRKKRGDYLYLVRAETNPETTSHKMDLNNHWGRANVLSVIDKINMLDLEKRVTEIYEQQQSKDKKTASQESVITQEANETDDPA